MAKKLKKLSPGMTYVYYDKKSKDIFSITNQIDSSYEYGIQVPVEDVKNILCGVEYKEDFIIDYKTDAEGNEALGIVSKKSARTAIKDSDYLFKNNMFEWISENNNDAALIVTWDLPSQNWKFSLSKEFKKTYSNDLIINKLIFFVTLSTDLDFLIRTIVVDFEELLKKDVTVGFDSALESTIDRISISTKLMLKDYKLIKIYE